MTLRGVIKQHNRESVLMLEQVFDTERCLQFCADAGWRKRIRESPEQEAANESEASQYSAIERPMISGR